MPVKRSADAVDAGEQLGVLVVGAGPTGLTLAAQLCAFGVSVRIVDRQLDRVHESRALAVLPRTLEVLRSLGASPELVERGNDAVQLQMHFGGRVVRRRLFDVGLKDTAYPFLLFISQAETEAILNEHLAARGVHVERGVELIDFARDAQHIAGTLRHQNGSTEQFRARYLVGCDGARSIVRGIAGVPFEGGSYPQTFALGDLEVDGDLERDTAHAFIGASGMLLFFPLDRPASWRMLGMRPTTAAAGAEETPEPSLADLQAIADTSTGGSLRLRDPVWLTYFRLHHRHARQYRAGLVFLAGDAAHVHSPAGAQGMNTGIQDAWNLGWKLALVARGLATEALLDSYEAERWPIGRFVLRFTDRATTIATADSPVVRQVRTRLAPRLVPLVFRLTWLRAFGFRTLAQLRIHYRKSPAVHEGRPRLRRGPRAGDRLPDARIVADGRECWLQEVLATPAYHLMLCGSTESWNSAQLVVIQERYGDLVVVHRLVREPKPGVLHDPRGEAFDRLGVEHAAQYLVRPDGHIGYRCGGTDLSGLISDLARWLPGARRSGSLLDTYSRSSIH